MKVKNKLTVFIPFLFLMASLQVTIVQAVPGESAGAEDSFNNPLGITLGQTNGTLPGPATDGSIWYNIPLDTGNYTFNLTGATMTNFSLRLIDSIVCDPPAASCVDPIITMVVSGDFANFEILTTRNYLIQIFNLTSVTGAFTLDITLFTPAGIDEFSNPIFIVLISVLTLSIIIKHKRKR